MEQSGKGGVGVGESDTTVLPTCLSLRCGSSSACLPAGNPALELKLPHAIQMLPGQHTYLPHRALTTHPPNH